MRQIKMTEEIYRKILNEHFDLIYVLDDRGNYIYANDAYLSVIRMTMEELAGTNVHSFLKNGTINICVSDEVYRTKKKVVMFQDLFIDEKGKEAPIRYIIISTPILDEDGNVDHIFATMKSVEKLNDAYRAASRNAISSFHLQEDDTELPADIVAESAAMRNILKIVRTVANVDSSVLVQGESGTGKEVIANYLHRCSNRSGHPFVTINCASLPENLLESELFGYEKGAFTGAAAAKKGLFQEADHGTLFLDEINSLPLSLQGKLLRAIETRMIQRIGSTKQIPVDFRLVAATNQDLQALCGQKLFRPDLYYRLNVIPIRLSPLRERKEDILPLAQSFLSTYCQRFNRHLYMTSSTMEALLEYKWPGNVRELKNFMERTVILTLEDCIDIKKMGSDSFYLASVPQLFQNIPGSLSKIETSEASGTFNPPGTSDTSKAAGPPDASLSSAASASSAASVSSAGSGGRAAEESADAPVPVRPEQDVFCRMLANRTSLKDYLEQCEREYLQYVFQQESSTYKVAEMLDTSQSSIMRKKRKYKL